MKTIEIKGQNYFGSYRDIRKAYRDIFEEKRGLYLREFVALTHTKM